MFKQCTMHLKDFFYKEYFTREFQITENGRRSNRRFDPRKPLIENRDQFTEIKKQNNPVFAAANEILRNVTLQPNDYNLLKHPQFANIASECINVTTTYPGLILGTGYVHETNNEAEFKLGFYFDHTTGLPCIPGSSIKGVLRSVFPDFNQKHPFKTIVNINERQQSKVNFLTEILGWENEADKVSKIHQLELAIFKGVALNETKLLFDTGKEDIEFSSIYKRFCFYNGYISGARGNKIFETDTITPHGTDPLKSPTPLNFLKIRPNVTFTLPMIFGDLGFLNLERGSILNLFNNIITTTGIGAKTNVGYGQFK